MTTIQNLTIFQRENLLTLIFNLTSGLDDDEMEALKVNFSQEDLKSKIFFHFNPNYSYFIVLPFHQKRVFSSTSKVLQPLKICS